MASQHRAGEVVEAPSTLLAAVALPAGLRLVTAVADHRRACAEGAPDTLGPAMLAHQGEALGVINQGRKIDRVESSHKGAASSHGRVRVSYINSCPYTRRAESEPIPTSPPRNPIRATGVIDSVSRVYSEEPGTAAEVIIAPRDSKLEL